MNSGVETLEIQESTKIAEIINAFSNTSKDLLLIDSKTVISQPHLELLTDYPRRITTALVAIDKFGDCQVQNQQIRSASSNFHGIERGNNRFVGAVRLSQRQREEVLKSADDVAIGGIDGDVLDLLLVALTRNTVHVAAESVKSAPWIRTANQEKRSEMKKILSSYGENGLRLKLANRSNDGFFSVWCLRKISKLITWAAVRIGITPNQITIASLFIGIYAAYSFAQGTKSSLIIGALALQLSIIVDCVDGEIARYTRKFSNLGAWLDAVTDRVKEYLAFFGLAVGAARNGNDLWLAAMGMMIFQTFRHLSDYNFAAINKLRIPPLSPLAFNVALDARESREADPRGRFLFWLGKILNFPIGERWLLISLTAAIGGAKFTFTALPLVALISIAIVFRRRFRTMLNWSSSQFGNQLISTQLDLWRIKTSFLKKTNWLEPSLLRLAEGVVILLLFSISEEKSEIKFLLLFAIVFHHYDGMYRALQGSNKPNWLNNLGLFIGFRVLIIAIFVFTNTPLIWLVIYFLTLFVAAASLQWVRKLLVEK